MFRGIKWLRRFELNVKVKIKRLQSALDVERPPQRRDIDQSLSDVVKLGGDPDEHIPKAHSIYISRAALIT